LWVTTSSYAPNSLEQGKLDFAKSLAPLMINPKILTIHSDANINFQATAIVTPFEYFKRLENRTLNSITYRTNDDAVKGFTTMEWEKFYNSVIQEFFNYKSTNVLES
jgi:hypothetical protein